MKIKKPDKRSVVLFLLAVALLSVIVHFWDGLKSILVSIFT